MNRIDTDILKGYFEGTLSEDKKQLVRRWFTVDRLKGHLESSSMEIWKEIPIDADIRKLESQRVLDRIHHAIKLEESVFFKKPSGRTRVFRILSRAAAILFIPLLLASYLYYHSSKSVYETASEIYAPVGTRTTFTLPDGTSGFLNGGSTIKFPTVFPKKSRSLELTGEAYFNVVSDTKRPFIVATSELQVKVYGTSFNVMAYEDGNRTEVTLESGMVEVFKKDEEGSSSLAVLKPEQTLIYDSGKDASSLISGYTFQKTAWIEGKLVFRYEPLQEVIAKINRWYNVDIRIMDQELKNHSYYGTFQDETLEEILKLLKHTAPIHYSDLGRERQANGTYSKRIIEIYANP
jgi:ferric-dicitrate binding protein FerR (iron transport regulator)